MNFFFNSRISRVFPLAYPESSTDCTGEERMDESGETLGKMKNKDGGQRSAVLALPQHPNLATCPIGIRAEHSDVMTKKLNPHISF